MHFLVVARGILPKLLLSLRNLASDAACCRRIDRFLDENGAQEMAVPIADGGGEDGARVRAGLAQMEPLACGIFLLIVGRHMSARQVSQRIGMSEERVCRHFRTAMRQVAALREGAGGN